MRSMLLVAGNTIRAILSRSALYVWGFGGLLMFLRAGQAIFARSDNEAFVRALRANAVGGAMDAWGLGCMLAAMVLGGVMVAGDMTTRRAITVLARPVRRWEFLVGKFLGVWAFLVVTLAIGVSVGLAVAQYLGVAIDTGVLPYAVGQTLVATALFAAVSTVVGAHGSAIAGAAIGIALVVVPGYVEAMRGDENPTTARVGRVLDAVLPEPYRLQYGLVAWAPPPVPQARAGARVTRPRARPTLDTAEQRTMLAGNLAYAGVFLLVGCLVFARRDLSLH